MKHAVDEQAIRDEVTRRPPNVAIREDHYTPSGRPRSSPMYEVYIANDFLGKSRLIKSQVFAEVQDKAARSLLDWQTEEIRRRVAQAHADATSQAEMAVEEANAEAQKDIEAVRGLLEATLRVDDRIDWSTLFDRREFPQFVFNEAEPVAPVVRPPAPTPKSFWEWLLPPLKRRREARDAELGARFSAAKLRLQQEHQLNRLAWAERRDDALRGWELQRRAFCDQREAHNQALEQFKARFEGGEGDAIVEYLGQVFERSDYPDCFMVEHDVSFDPASEAAVVDLSLPSQAEVPKVVEYKFVKKTRDKKPVELKKKEHDELYDRAVKLAVIRTIHEVFEAEYTSHVQTVVCNGWVTALDPATGHDRTSCVISVSADRTKFEAMNLARIDPTECIRALKGLVAGPLSQVAPVQPILQLNREDSRFVESRAVLAEINSHQNLAEMPWEDFEHLVRDLFEKMFASEDAEVRITQASRDMGVDAIAFDPDPIRGGKFVIQAKRYTNVVGVSAVRDLYGTMISEGAVKGILVTTSHYGKESRDFAKDKPITLIDGSNLVYLLERYGHNVRIDVDRARSQRAISSSS